jgi:hypothetical protein
MATRCVTVCFELTVEATSPQDAAEQALTLVQRHTYPCEVLDNIEPGCSDRQWQVDLVRNSITVTVDGTTPSHYTTFPPLTRQ